MFVVYYCECAYNYCQLACHAGTGNRGNRWNLVTYRLALAVYTRSPAAYEALKSFNILQLPSKCSLQAFLSENSSNPGVNEEKISQQKHLYDAFREKKRKEGKQEPRGDGILIFDEVKVQNKVCQLYICSLIMSNSQLFTPINHAGHMEF